MQHKFVKVRKFQLVKGKRVLKVCVENRLAENYAKGEKVLNNISIY